MFSAYFRVYRFVSLCYVLVKLNGGCGLPFQTDGNTIHFPTSEYKNLTLHNITNNNLGTGEKLPSTSSTESVNQSFVTDVNGSSFGQEESLPTNSTTLKTIPRTTLPPTKHTGTNLSTLPYNTTVSPSHGTNKHHFAVKILLYILIPVGCVVAVIILFFVVRHVQKVRRKRRLERELLHQYSYPNSEADDMEEQNIGEIESVINAQFVAYSDRSDKNIYEDTTEVDLAFGESSKLVVQEPPSPSEDLEVSTSFNS